MQEIIHILTHVNFNINFYSTARYGVILSFKVRQTLKLRNFPSLYSLPTFQTRLKAFCLGVKIWYLVKSSKTLG